MRWFVAASSVLVCACRPATVPHGGDTSGAGSDGTDDGAVTAMLDATGPHGSSGGAATSSTGAASTTEGAEDSDDGHVDEGPKLDSSPSMLGSCAASDAQHVELEVVTPDGPFAATYAWWAWDLCCIVEPRLILAEVPELEIDRGNITTPHIAVFALGTWGHEGPYEGALPVGLREGMFGPFSEFETGFVLLEPLDSAVPAEGELPLFSATFAILGESWSVAGSVDAPYCADATGPPCPCE